MEISNRLSLQQTAPSQATSRQAQPAEQVAATEQVQNRTSTGVTVYVNQGEVLPGQGTSDYRDLIREARQQQVQAGEQRDIPPGGGNQNANAARAVATYQSSAETPAAAAQRQSFDRIV